MFALVLLLAVSVVTSTPAWALALADHGCCAPAATSKNQATTAKNIAANKSKHAHCAAMAAHIPSQFAGTQSPAKITGLHSCKTCAGVTAQFPRSAMNPTTLSATVIPSRYELRAAPQQRRTLQNVFVTDPRGPPAFLL